MNSTTPVQPQNSEQESCRILPTVQENKLRPKLPLLRILREAGAHDQSFTVKEVMHYLGQYIMIKQLYDKEEQHIVRCGQDDLGVLLGVQSFSVKDPSPLYDMLKRSLLPASVQDAAKTLTVARNQSTELLRQDQPQSSAGTDFDASGRVDGAALLKRRLSQEDILVEDTMPPPCKQPKLELVFEEWDVAGLPWWFLGNLRNNYEPLSNGSTDIPTNRDIDTAVVSDTTDDLWFLNEAGSEQHSMEAKVETQDSDQGNDLNHSGAESKNSSNEVCDATFEEYLEDSQRLEDSQCLSDDTDTDNASEDCWQCTKCKKFNSPIKRYCFRCWALRKDWYMDCPKIVHSLSTSNIIAKFGGTDSNTGMDIPDCRRTISAPVVRPKDLQPLCERHRLLSGGPESLDLAQPVASESQSKPLSISQKSEERRKVEGLVQSDSSKYVLDPCLLCQRKPRNGTIIHGRTAHLVTCFLCAKNLHRTGLPCPVCKKKINMVIKTFVG